MHLLLAQKGALADADEAIDLGQTPADLVFISAADSELASLSAAAAGLSGGPDLRLANMMALSHPMSIDVYAHQTVAGSRMVVVRVLGGESYWPYGLEVLHATCVQAKNPLIVLPGDDKPDPSLERFNTLDHDVRLTIWNYLREGGDDNARNLLRYCNHLLGAEDAEIPPPKPLLKAGLWWPGLAAPSIEQVREQWQADAPVVALSFYRALLQSGNTQPVEDLITALTRLDLNPLPIFISSLKDDLSQATVRVLFENAQPGVVINMTGFAVSSPDGTRVPTVLEEGGAVVLQAILLGSGEEDWLGSDQGLSSRDLAMNVALPEVDGRVLSRAIAFKNAEQYDTSTQSNIVRHVARADRIDFVAQLAKSWIALKTTPAGQRRIALVLANYPNRDGRLGNGVGLDTPAATVEVLRAMRSASYPVADIPENGDDLITHLQDGPTNAATDGREIRETYSLSRYKALFATLPKTIQDQVNARWGEPGTDPFFLKEQQEFALPLCRFGDVMVGIQPARGYNINPTDTYHSPDLVPPHGYFAFYFFLRDQYGAHAICHMGKHGNLEWLPGKALSLSTHCYPEAVFGPLPHLYPFIVNDPGEGTQAKRRTSAVIIDHLTPPLTRAESYGPLKQLEALVDEYYEAAGVDPRRLNYLKSEILDLMRDTGLDRDAGIESGEETGQALEKLDAYLCELKEMQIRDGPAHLWMFATGTFEIGSGRGRWCGCRGAWARAGMPACKGHWLMIWLSRSILIRWIVIWAVRGRGRKPDVLAQCDDSVWRTNGDTVERLEILASRLVSGELGMLPRLGQHPAGHARVV